MIKKILVPTDGSALAGIGAEYAISLAKQHGASLHGLHVVDIKLLEGPFLRDISSSLGTAPYVNYQNNIAMILEERGKVALESLATQCEAEGVSCETTQVRGTVPGSIVKHSELMDLIVMGRGGEHVEWLDGLLGSTTEAVVRRAGVPVLVTDRASAKMRRFVVAYDGSPHANKALHTGADIGETWGVPFDVLVVGLRDTEDMLQQARSYLEAHEVDVEYVSRDGDPREVIVAYAGERDADLLVIGAYGHAKVLELVVGSTTAHTLNHSPCPVLLTQ